MLQKLLSGFTSLSKPQLYLNTLSQLSKDQKLLLSVEAGMKIRISSRKLVLVHGESLCLLLFTGRGQTFWWSAYGWNSAELLSVSCNSSKVKYHIPTETHARLCLKERNKNMSACCVDLIWHNCDHTPDYKTAFCLSMNTEVDCVRAIGCHGSLTACQWFPWRVGMKSSQFRIQYHILAGLPLLFLDTL